MLLSDLSAAQPKARQASRAWRSTGLSLLASEVGIIVMASFTFGRMGKSGSVSPTLPLSSFLTWGRFLDKSGTHPVCVLSTYHMLSLVTKEEKRKSHSPVTFLRTCALRGGGHGTCWCFHSLGQLSSDEALPR